jgi:hypothetical protein
LSASVGENFTSWNTAGVVGRARVLRGRFCLPASKQCSGCVQELREKKRAEREAEQKEYEEWAEEYPLQQCKSKGKKKPDGTYEWECKNQTRYSLCKECYNTEKFYTIRR